MTPLAGCTFAVFDFETTGTDPYTCMPVSAAVVTATLGRRGTIEPVVELDCVINPGIPIPEEASAVHGITDEIAARGADPLETAERIADVLRRVDLVLTHNIPYDGRILNRLSGWIPGAFTCSLVLANVVDKYQKGKKLSDVCGRRGITFDAHLAVDDCVAVAKVLPYLLYDGMRAGSIPNPSRDGGTIGALTDWTIAAGIERDADYAAYCKRANKPAPTPAWIPFRDLITPF